MTDARKDMVIEVGATYHGKGQGRIIRKVLGVGREHRPENWFGKGSAPDDDGVFFEERRRRDNALVCREYLYMRSFKAWVGGKV